MITGNHTMNTGGMMTNVARRRNIVLVETIHYLLLVSMILYNYSPQHIAEEIDSLLLLLLTWLVTLIFRHCIAFCNV
jgi:hypothetical protein